MIERIYFANEGAYDAAGTELDGLKELNFIFGSNGSGKTTISRIVEGTGTFSDCHITWSSGNRQETRVYNKDFVESHFDAESSLKGIYTFGENVEIAEQIKTLKGESNEIQTKLGGLRRNLYGEGETSGKKKERETLYQRLVEDIWYAKTQMKALDDAFKGLKTNKKGFCERYLKEAPSNVATLKDIAELKESATTVYSDSLVKATPLHNSSSSEVSTLEGAAILLKKIIGKVDVDISAIIGKLGNSDWVQQGRQYFDKLEEQCPFCQQATDSAFRQSLEAYFDESYIADLAAIDKLHDDYTNAVEKLRC